MDRLNRFKTRPSAKWKFPEWFLIRADLWGYSWEKYRRLCYLVLGYLRRLHHKVDVGRRTRHFRIKVCERGEVVRPLPAKVHLT